MQVFLFSLHCLVLSLFACSCLAASLAQEAEPQKPNFVIIYTDDMGIGDVSHNGGLAPTPFIDAMAEEGMRFTDAHSSSSVCTPSRYTLLTGRYNWRTRLKEGVFMKVTDKPLIEPGEETLASFLDKQGYQSALVGKWHLGMDFPLLEELAQQKEGKKTINEKPVWRIDDEDSESTIRHLRAMLGRGWEVDYSQPIRITPLNHGFDYFYGIQASLDMPPYVYIENDRFVSEPTVEKHYHRTGAAAANFDARDCLKVFAKKSRQFIADKAAKKEPFFLYLSLTSPHTPIVPSEEWQEKSELGKYGDFLMETDWVVGEVRAELAKQGLSENTLVIFTADNGCAPTANIGALAKLGHKANGELRGMKSDVFEGGHRVPFVAIWPGVIPAGTVSDRLSYQGDLMATFAEILGQELAPNAGVDSESMWANLQNPGAGERQSALVSHSIRGAFAIRQGKWKLIFHPGSGGWSRADPNEHNFQLYNLEEDLGETNNLYTEQPELVAELTALMQQYADNGRSTPGEAQENDGEVIFLWAEKKKK